jgi:hypothetical protein
VLFWAELATKRCNENDLVCCEVALPKLRATRTLCFRDYVAVLSWGEAYGWRLQREWVDPLFGQLRGMMVRLFEW